MKRELKIFDNPKNVKRLLILFYISLFILLILDLLIHRHSEFAFESSLEFYAVYGFVSCVALIFIAKILRIFVKRSEDYYSK